MYRFKDREAFKMYNKVQAAKVIGLHVDTLRRVVAGSQDCTKLVAYAITKFLDKNAEINIYFDYIRGGK